jgi:hypothetical protein
MWKKTLNRCFTPQLDIIKAMRLQAPGKRQNGGEHRSHSRVASTTMMRRDVTERIQIETLFCRICHSDVHSAPTAARPDSFVDNTHPLKERQCKSAS